MTPEARAAAEAAAVQLDAEMDLAEVRRAMKLSQEELGQTLQINQGAVAKIEKRADMYVSTLRRFMRLWAGNWRLSPIRRSHRQEQELFRRVGEGGRLMCIHSDYGLAFG